MSPQQRLALIVPSILLMLVTGLMFANFNNAIIVIAGIGFSWGFICMCDATYTAMTYDRDTNDDNRVIAFSFLNTCFTIIGLGLLIFT